MRDGRSVRGAGTWCRDAPLRHVSTCGAPALRPCWDAQARGAAFLKTTLRAAISQPGSFSGSGRGSDSTLHCMAPHAHARPLARQESSWVLRTNLTISHQGRSDRRGVVLIRGVVQRKRLERRRRVRRRLKHGAPHPGTFCTAAPAPGCLFCSLALCALLELVPLPGSALKCSALK